MKTINSSEKRVSAIKAKEQLLSSFGKHLSSLIGKRMADTEKKNTDKFISAKDWSFADGFFNYFYMPGNRG